MERFQRQRPGAFPKNIWYAFSFFRKFQVLELKQTTDADEINKHNEMIAHMIEMTQKILDGTHQIGMFPPRPPLEVVKMSDDMQEAWDEVYRIYKEERHAYEDNALEEYIEAE